MDDTKRREIQMCSTYDCISESLLAEEREKISTLFEVSPDSIKFQLQTEDDYGSIGALLVAVFNSPKTDKELAEEQRVHEIQEDREREQYERLQTKFGKE